MNLDRRSPERASLTRREATRTPAWKRVYWKLDGDSEMRRALLVSASERGLAILANTGETPELGDCIRLGSRTRQWRRKAHVVRVEPVSVTTTRVAAEFSETD